MAMIGVANGHMNARDFMPQLDDVAYQCIAETATSRLYRVEARGLWPPLALKMLKEEHASQPLLQGRFANEAEILRSVNHYGLPKLLASADACARPFLIYRFIDGMSIREQLNREGRGAFSVRQACRVAFALLRILEHLHDKVRPCIVHGDISPENVIVVPHAGVRLIDFGTAQRLGPEHAIDTRWIGKPSYLSPQQAQGLPWDHRSDLYQVGLVFYEMLTGKKRSRAASARAAVLRAAHPDAMDSRDVPSFLRPFLERIVDPAPGGRFASASQAGAALRVVLAQWGAVI